MQKTPSTAPNCIYGSKMPMIAVWRGRYIEVIQASCGKWDCPKCGPGVARAWYAKLIFGAKRLHSEGKELSFITLTCRGAEISRDEADRDYYKWTNRILSTLRARAKKEGGELSYAQITERQTRGHPHSHILATGVRLKSNTCVRVNCPGGSEPYHVSGRGKGMCGFNADLVQMAVRAGLGPMVKITPVQDTEGAAKYIAKYLFKPGMVTEKWPKGWHRVRVSRNWPLAGYEPSKSFPLVSPGDYNGLNGYEVSEPDEETGILERRSIKPAFVRVMGDELKEIVRHHIIPGEDTVPFFAYDEQLGRSVFIAMISPDEL